MFSEYRPGLYNCIIVLLHYSCVRTETKWLSFLLELEVKMKTAFETCLHPSVNDTIHLTDSSI